MFNLLYGDAVVDQAGELELVVAARLAGPVQFASVALGAAL